MTMLNLNGEPAGFDQSTYDPISRTWEHKYIICGGPQAAAIRAHVEFQGRDRRRIKREVNKAMRKARARS
jgi:hypothetical protein